ncbi:hypothetical protein E3N88_29488 [Mikania micrantha]|uniref:Uncharacterized protein n=1 Tax=Mikania micrantha TaxID=192012 RepID=A0A5N6MIZ3_9ASTR|nr:hypothetical protein E3N88_29488 [Mikania micrantha]
MGFLNLRNELGFLNENRANIDLIDNRQWMYEMTDSTGFLTVDIDIVNIAIIQRLNKIIEELVKEKESEKAEKEKEKAEKEAMLERMASIESLLILDV